MHKNVASRLHVIKCGSFPRRLKALGSFKYTERSCPFGKLASYFAVFGRQRIQELALFIYELRIEWANEDEREPASVVDFLVLWVPHHFLVSFTTNQQN